MREHILSKATQGKAMISALLLFFLACLLFQSAALAVDPRLGESAQIKEAQARSIALGNAGLTEADVNFTKLILHRRDGQVVYDMEFLSKTSVYHYEINAATGGIVAHYIKERRDPRQQPSSMGSNARGKYPDSSDYIGAERAKALAFAHAGVNDSAVRRLKVEVDKEHGRMVYEVDFDHGGMEYEYEIDALTGKILWWESEWD